MQNVSMLFKTCFEQCGGFKTILVQFLFLLSPVNAKQFRLPTRCRGASWMLRAAQQARNFKFENGRIWGEI